MSRRPEVLETVRDVARAEERVVRAERTVLAMARRASPWSAELARAAQLLQVAHRAERAARARLRRRR